MKLLAALLAVVSCASGCGYSASTTQSWSEEVAVGDGRSIQIDRQEVFSVSNRDAEKESGRKSVIKFRDALANLPAWIEPLRPALLYENPTTRQWVVVALRSNCEDASKASRSYDEYRLDGDGWHRADLSEASIGRDSNLYIGSFENLPKSPISMAAKSEMARATIARDGVAHCS